VQDRVSNQLTRTVPSDLAATVNVNYWSAISWPFKSFGATASGINRRMLE
jgi:hypothetical protein